MESNATKATKKQMQQTANAFDGFKYHIVIANRTCHKMALNTGQREMFISPCHLIDPFQTGGLGLWFGSIMTND